ncbi:MAG: tetratricopeptide repeat protein [Burkholderiaceae bacterium]|jgi:tetratricopeptide (TPR) repeat protein|nr:tetratricopeptide repeat protein [Burkholderiaceae bacterium]
MKFYRSVQTGMVLVMAGCSALSQAPDLPHAAASASQAIESSALTGPLLYELLVSEITFRQGDAQAGVSYMLEAARRTGDESLYKRATEMAISSRSGPAALETARAWRRAFPQSIRAARFELQVLIVLGRVAETEDLVRKLAAMLPADERESFMAVLPELYKRVPEPAEAARTIEAALRDALETPALAPAAWAAIGHLRLQAGDKRGALSAAMLGQAAGAQSEWPASLALQLLSGADLPEAEALVSRYLDTPQAKPELRINYARTLVERGRVSDAHTQLDTLTRQQPDYLEGWLVQGALLADERRDDQAEPILRRFLQLADAQANQPGMEREGPRAQARLMLAGIAERRGNLAEAEQLLGQIDSPEQILAVRLRRAQMLARQGKLDEAREVIRSTPEREPEDARNKLLAEVQLLRENQLPEQSYQLLSEALNADPDDTALLYDAALAAESAGRWQDMERLLRRLIEVAPQDASAYNALGYSLADRGERLHEAKALIEKAVKLSPDDHFIQDSLGWVEFRLGRVQEARGLLEAAYKKRPDPEIAAHLGEVLWVLGEHEAARAIWREGQRLDPDNATLVKTLQRLKVSP